MTNIALVVFGNADGMNVIEEPRGFRMGESLEQTVDFAYPFRWGKEVYRAVNFEQAGNRYLFIALHTKIDDLRGSRDGAHAGAGVFIREGVCDGAIVVDVLRRMLSTLIKEASNGAQFTSKLQAIEAIMRPVLKVGVETLTRVWQPATVKVKLTSNDAISIVDASDWRVSTPDQFVEFASHALTYERGQYLYASDPEMRNDVPFTGKHERVSLSQRVFNLPASFAASYSRSEEARRESQSQLGEYQNQVRKLEEIVTLTKSESGVLREELSVIRNNQLSHNNLIQQITELERTNMRLQHKLSDAEFQIKGFKSNPGRKDGDAHFIDSQRKEIARLAEKIGKLEDELDDIESNKKKPLFGGLKNKILAFSGAGLLLAGGALGTILGSSGGSEEQEKAWVAKVDESKKDAKDELEKVKREADAKIGTVQGLLNTAQGRIKELENDISTRSNVIPATRKAAAPAAEKKGSAAAAPAAEKKGSAAAAPAAEKKGSAAAAPAEDEKKNQPSE